MRRMLGAVGVVLGLVGASGVSPVPLEVTAVAADSGGVQLVDLGTLGGTPGRATALNDRGEVVGWSETDTFRPHAFLWRRGHMTDLGSLGGRFGVSEANDINNRGEIVGSTTASTTDFATHAFLWRDGVMTDLGTLGGVASEALAINDRGEVVGTYYTGQGLERRAFIWRDGEMTDLGALQGFPLIEATDVNERGQAVANSRVGPALWDDGAVTALAPPPGTVVTEVAGINDRGQVVGYAEMSATSRHTAIVWRGGSPVSLGTLGGTGSGANAINERGQIVGWSLTADNTFRAFVWKHGTMSALPTLSPDYVSTADDINERGHAVGYSTTADGNVRAVLWK